MKERTCQIHAGAAALLAAAMSWTSAVAGEAPADLLILNGRMPTVAGAAARGLAIRGDRIIRVGDDQQILALKGPRTQVIDAHDRTVVPGFNDNHVHLLWGARSIAAPDVRALPDLAAIQHSIGAYAAAHPELAWVDAGGWVPSQLPASGPDRRMLDKISATRPIVLWSLDRHSAWLNSKALELAGIASATANPPQGEIVKDPVSGEPTGWLKEISAVSMLERAMPPLSKAERQRLIGLAMAEAHRFGVTSVNEAWGDVEEFELLDEMRRKGRLSLRISYALRVTPGFTDKDFDRYQAVWAKHPATPWLKTGVVKFFLDGVPNAHTAFLLAPWGPQPSPGDGIYDTGEISRLVGKFDAAGWQVMMHAMGDAAVRQGLDAVAAAEAANPPPARGRRHRIEHAFLINPADVPRFAQLGVQAAYQPVDAFLAPAKPTLPADPARAPQDGARWNAIQAAGGRVSLGSDWPVFTMNALARIYGIVDSRRGDQRMSLPAAIKAYTEDSAYASFNDTDRGRLAVGQYADVAILSRDLEGDPPHVSDDLAVDVTIQAGRVVYSRNKL